MVTFVKNLLETITFSGEGHFFFRKEGWVVFDIRACFGFEIP